MASLAADWSRSFIGEVIVLFVLLLPNNHRLSVSSVNCMIDRSGSE